MPGGGGDRRNRSARRTSAATPLASSLAPGTGRRSPLSANSAAVIAPSTRPARLAPSATSAGPAATSAMVGSGPSGCAIAGWNISPPCAASWCACTTHVRGPSPISATTLVVSRRGRARRSARHGPSTSSTTASAPSRPTRRLPVIAASAGGSPYGHQWVPCARSVSRRPPSHSATRIAATRSPGVAEPRSGIAARASTTRRASSASDIRGRYSR